MASVEYRPEISSDPAADCRHRQRADDLAAGNLIGALGDPIAADVALIRFAFLLGLGPIGDAVEGTLLNIAHLIP